MAMVLDTLASYVNNMLKEMAKEEIDILLGVSGEIDKMGVKLMDLKNFLADADRRNIADQSVQAWVGEFRDAMYDATDIMDLCQLKAMEQGTSRPNVSCLNPLLFCMRNPLHAHNIGNRIKKLNKRLDGIEKRGKAFSFTNLGAYEDHPRQVAYPRRSTSRETSGEIDASSVVGEKIQEDTKTLVHMLTNTNGTRRGYDRIRVFSIVGIGGIGKTTLAQKVFNDGSIQQDFKKKIWLSVNQHFNEAELLKRSITEAGSDHQAAGDTKATLQRTLKEALKGHKTLLVMDDVWTHYAWENVLKTPLVNVVAAGSCVLVTTRHETVARAMKAKAPYHRVDKLEPEDAWCLLKKQVIEDENEEHEIDNLKAIGMQIVEKCDCLPLAVKVIGGLLCQKNRRQGDWENVLNDFVCSASKLPEEVNNAIYLSYNDLPASLKKFFLHCALLPKGFHLVESVIGMWISEGQFDGNLHELENIGRKYYDELMLRNLIDTNKIRDTTQLYWYCNMHDVVRAFARYVAKDEALVAHTAEVNISTKLNSQKFFRLALVKEGSESNELDWRLIQEQKSLRTLILFGSLKIRTADSLAAFSSLRTLHMAFADCDSLVESLYQLKHLRYLSMEQCAISKLPENIGNQKFLQYINVAGNQSLVKLPNSIIELHQLRSLNFSCTGVNKIPKGFCVLNNLRSLGGFPAHVDGDWCSLEELGPLSELNSLCIHDLVNVPTSSFAKKARLAGKVHLSYLGLVCYGRPQNNGQWIKEKDKFSAEDQKQLEEVLDELCPPSCLEDLAIYECFAQRLPRWMMSKAVGEPLNSLRILKIEDLDFCIELPDSLCQLPRLEFLQIIRAPVIKRVGHEFLQAYHHEHNRSQELVGFPRLHVLKFVGMVEWEEWEWGEQVPAMPTMEELLLKRCKLMCLPAGLALHARALRKLYVHNVENLRSLENFVSVTDLEVWECPDLERISNLQKLLKLDIFKCQKMNVLEGVPALQKLILCDYCMESLPKYLNAVIPRHLQLYCNVSLLIFIAARETSFEWDKFSHIHHVQANTFDDISREGYVLYTRDPFSFETNVNRSVIVRACVERKRYAYSRTCSIEDEWTVRSSTADERRQPLCVRFRCNAYFHLVGWLRLACLHCNEGDCIASSSLA